MHTIRKIKDMGEGNSITPQKVEDYIMSNPGKTGFTQTLLDVASLNQMNGYDARHKLVLLTTCLKLVRECHNMDTILSDYCRPEAQVIEILMKYICKVIHSLNQSKKYANKRYSFELITTIEDA